MFDEVDPRRGPFRGSSGPGRLSRPSLDLAGPTSPDPPRRHSPISDSSTQAKPSRPSSKSTTPRNLALRLFRTGCGAERRPNSLRGMPTTVDATNPAALRNAQAARIHVRSPRRQLVRKPSFSTPHDLGLDRDGSASLEPTQKRRCGRGLAEGPGGPAPAEITAPEHRAANLAVQRAGWRPRRPGALRLGRQGRHP